MGNGAIFPDAGRGALSGRGWSTVARRQSRERSSHCGTISSSRCHWPGAPIRSKEANSYSGFLSLALSPTLIQTRLRSHSSFNGAMLAFCVGEAPD